MNDSTSSSIARPMAPIFIIGSGRSGTTLLFRLLCGHPNLAWISRLTDRFPRLPYLAFLSKFSFLPLKPILPSYESINSYKYCGLTANTHRTKGKSLDGDDVTKPSYLKMHYIVSNHMKWMGKRRFINKNTLNTMRIKYLLKIFPDAYFIHIIRNGYAVCNSLNNVDWWENLNLWWLNKTPKQWIAGGGLPFEICALHWKRQVLEALENKNAIPENHYLECRYEDLLIEPRKTIDNIIRFCELDISNDFLKHLNSVSIKKQSLDNWSKKLSNEAKATITETAGDLLQNLNYRLQ